MFSFIKCSNIFRAKIFKISNVKYCALCNKFMLDVNGLEKCQIDLNHSLE